MSDVANQPGSGERPSVTPGGRPGPLKPRFDWGAFGSHLTTFFSVVIVLSLGIGFLLLRTPVKQKAEAVVSREPTTIRFEWPELKRPPEATTVGARTAATHAMSATISDAPPERARTWLSPQFQEELMTLAYRALGSDPDPLSREPLDAIGAAMEKSGWFDGRPSVQRGAAAEIVIRGNWRIPAAVVRHASTPTSEPKDYLVSWDGRPMPVVYPQGKSGLLVVRGVASEPVTVDGAIDYRAAWPGEDLQAGLELLRTLVVEPWRAQVAGIDVSEYADTRSLAIDTVYQTRLVWGGRPSRPLAGECTTRAKLGKIGELVGYTRRIDGGKGEIELWWPINKTLEIDRTANRRADEATATADAANR